MEYFDIYDSDHEVTGRTAPRYGTFLQPGEYCLIVLGMIRRSDGTFLITKRAMDKRWAAGWWEMPGGGVRAGETSVEAVLREIREETGLSLSPEEGRCVHTYHMDNPDDGDNYFVDIYLFDRDFEPEEVKIEEHESTAWKAASFEEIKRYADEGRFLHYSRIETALIKADSEGREEKDAE